MGWFLLFQEGDSLAEHAKIAEGAAGWRQGRGDSAVSRSFVVIGSPHSGSHMQLTSEQRTRSSRWLWTSIVGWVMLPSLVVILSDSVPGWLCVTLIIASWLLLGWGVVVSRKRTFCMACGSRVLWGELYLPRDVVEKTIKENRLRPPFQVKSMLRSKADWRFVVQTCEKCRYKRIVSMAPTNWD